LHLIVTSVSFLTLVVQALGVRRQDRFNSPVALQWAAEERYVRRID